MFTMLDKLVEDVNYVFDEDVIAKIKGDVLYLTDTRVSRHADFETLEDSLQEVFDYVINKYNINLDVLDMNGRTVALEVITY